MEGGAAQEGMGVVFKTCGLSIGAGLVLQVEHNAAWEMEVYVLFPQQCPCSVSVLLPLTQQCPCSARAMRMQCCKPLVD